jgi:hypothetical protein
MYVHKDVYEPLNEALVAYTRTVKVGNCASRVSSSGRTPKTKADGFLTGGLPDAGSPAYGASKPGVIALTATLAEA